MIHFVCTFLLQRAKILNKFKISKKNDEKVSKNIKNISISNNRRELSYTFAENVTPKETKDLFTTTDGTDDTDIENRDTSYQATRFPVPSALVLYFSNS